MTILCGFDFSEGARAAATVAALLARKRQEPLVLAHALADWAGPLPGAEGESVLELARQTLGRDTEHLKARTGLEAQAALAQGAPEATLLELARAHGASLLVVGASGRGFDGSQRLGRTADRLAQTATIPVLVVESAEPFEAWLAGQRPLRVLVGLDFNLVSEDAWRWATGLAKAGPLTLTRAHVFWPPQELSRLGLTGVRSFVDVDPEVDRVLKRDLEARFPSAGLEVRTVLEPGLGRSAGLEVRTVLEPGLGRPADHLLAMAATAQADVVVVGSHQRRALNRLWEGSVSRGVLHGAHGAVASVPLGAHHAEAPPPVRTVLTATDFSPVGDTAIAHAFAQARPGGKVYLVHVLEPPVRGTDLAPHDIFTVADVPEAQRAAAIRALAGLVPPRAGQEGVAAEVVLLAAPSPGQAIAQAAERLGVDLLCLGTHGRTGVARAVLGSVAQAVLSSTHRPVLLVRPASP